MAQRGVQLVHLRRSRALLRAKYRRGATWPTERIVDIGGNQHFNLRQPGIQSGQVDMAQPRQRLAARWQIPTIGIQQAHTKCAQQTGTAIVGCAAAEAQHDPPHPGIQRRADQLAGAEAARPQHIAPRLLDPMQSAGLGHFDHSPTPRQQSPVGGYRITQRAADLGPLPLAPGRGQYRINRAFAAISHRAEQQFRIGINPRPARRDGFSNSAGTQAFLERIGGDNQFHQSSTRLSSQTVIMPAMPCIRVPRVCAR